MGEDWRDFYKEYYDVVRDWHKQGFITIHQWRNFIDYLDMFVRRKLKEQAKKIFEEMWRRECPKCGYPELIVTEWRSPRFPKRVGNGFIAMCPKCGSKFTGTLVLTENLEKQFGVEDE